MRCRWHHALGASWLGACERALCIVPHHRFVFLCLSFSFCHTKEHERDVRLITRCSITNTLRAFCLVGFNGSEHKANCTAVCGAAGTMHLELVGWEHVKELLVLFHTMCCIFMFVLFFFLTYFFGCTY